MKPLIRQALFLFLSGVIAVSCSRRETPTGAHPSSAEKMEELATALIRRALQHRKDHRWTEALDDYRAAKELAPHEPEVHRGVRLFERLAPFLGTIRELEAQLAAHPDDDQLLADRALLFLRSDDSELGLLDSEAAMQKADWAVRPKLFRGIALIELGRSAECEQMGIEQPLRLSALTPEFLETVARLDAGISVERENAELYVSRAWQLNEIGQPRLALADAETALRHDPRSAGAHLESGYALAKLKRNGEALDHLRQATSLDANLSAAWQYQGELEIALGDFRAAVESLSRSLTLSPTYAALEKRAHAYEQIGMRDKAEEDRQALQAVNVRP